MLDEPFFLELEHVEAIHLRSLQEHGGSTGLGNPGGLESAVMQPRNVYLYLGGDVFEIAAAYAYHIAEAQAYVDGNKRTAIASALVFLECNGVGTTGIDPMELYQPMIDVSAHALGREGLAKLFRGLFV